MIKHILFNFASRQRAPKFHAVVDYIKEFVKQPYTILAKIDDDDPTKQQYLRDNVQFAFGVSGSKIAAINRSIPETGWDILVNVSDDIEFTNPDFAEIIRYHCGPDDFLLFPEPFADNQAAKGKNERIAIMSVMGREYYNRDGYVYHPAYKSLFCDNEATAVARKRGRLKEIETPIFYHAHPAAGYGKPDALLKHTESFWNEDKKTYLQRKAAGFP